MVVGTALTVGLTTGGKLSKLLFKGLPLIKAAAVKVAPKIPSSLKSVGKFLFTTKTGLAAQLILGAALTSPKIREKVKKEPLLITPLAPIVAGKSIGKAFEGVSDPTLTTGEKLKKVAIAGGVVGVIGAGALAVQRKLKDKGTTLTVLAPTTPKVKERTEKPIVGDIPVLAETPKPITDQKVIKDAIPRITIKNMPKNTIIVQNVLN